MDRIKSALEAIGFVIQLLFSALIGLIVMVLMYALAIGFALAPIGLIGWILYVLIK